MYEHWQRHCLKQFNERFNENRTTYEWSEDTDPETLVEFSEDGSAYPHGIGGTTHIPNAVTPWSLFNG